MEKHYVLYRLCFVFILQANEKISSELTTQKKITERAEGKLVSSVSYLSDFNLWFLAPSSAPRLV